MEGSQSRIKRVIAIAASLEPLSEALRAEFAPPHISEMKAPHAHSAWLACISEAFGGDSRIADCRRRHAWGSGDRSSAGFGGGFQGDWKGDALAKNKPDRSHVEDVKIVTNTYIEIVHSFPRSSAFECSSVDCAASSPVHRITVMVVAVCPTVFGLLCCASSLSRAGLRHVCSVSPAESNDTPAWPKPKLRFQAQRPPPREGLGSRRQQASDIAEYTADGLRLKERVPLEHIDDSSLRTLVTRSAEPALVFFTDGSAECLLAEAVLERSGAERRRDSRLGETDQLRMVRASMSDSGRLFAWTRSQGQPLSLNNFPACVLFVRGSPVATLFGPFTHQELARFIYNGFNKK
eukprot:scaffold31895_cov157-Isochrysis_galbana.AAC.2